MFLWRIVSQLELPVCDFKGGWVVSRGAGLVERSTQSPT